MALNKQKDVFRKLLKQNKRGPTVKVTTNCQLTIKRIAELNPDNWLRTNVGKMQLQCRQRNTNDL